MPNDKACNTPLVSIGVPVFNGEQTIRHMLATLQQQSYPNIELIISDNASTDRTEEICRQIAAEDSRVRYFRQASNAGPIHNFRSVLMKAEGPLFMWAAADDEWAPSFVEENLRVLLQHPDTVGCVSRIQMRINGKLFETRTGVEPLLGAPAENIAQFLKSPGLNGRFYALYRTQSLRKCFSDEVLWGFDHVIIARLLTLGKIEQTPKILMWRNLRGESSNPLYAIRRYNKTLAGRIVPLAPAALRLLRTKEFPLTAGSAYAIVVWVLGSFLHHASLHIKLLLHLGMGKHRNSLSQWPTREIERYESER